MGRCPVIVLIGDIGNVDNEKFRVLRRFYLDGVLSAAFKSGAVIVDSGLSTSIGVGAQNDKTHTDFCRSSYHIGVSPVALLRGQNKRAFFTLTAAYEYVSFSIFRALQ